MEDTMLGKLHHVEVYVSHLESSKLFWGWLLEKLGYSVYQSWQEGVSYVLEESYIVFVQVEPKHMSPSYHRSKVGLNHLAFHAPTREFIDEMTKALREKGVTILYEDRHPYAGGPDYYAVFFEDPDRIKVEITLTPSAYEATDVKEIDVYERAAQGQLDAYNAHDIEGFLRWYTEDVVATEGDGRVIFSGLEAMRERYTSLFKSEGLHCQLKNRMVLGQRVIDHERIVRHVGATPFEAIAIYTVTPQGLIQSVQFLR
jgi:catechol 2,3-dioxygenase-like lactoylglutathione lyase family enzyme